LKHHSSIAAARPTGLLRKGGVLRASLA
jgi:hypothetical protein